MTEHEIRVLCQAEFEDLVSAVASLDARRGRVRVSFHNGSFLDIHQHGPGYSYHWQGHNTFIRFDNAPHFPDMTTAPHHLHIGDRQVTVSEVRGVSAVDLQRVLRFIAESL